MHALADFCMGCALPFSTLKLQLHQAAACVLVGALQRLEMPLACMHKSAGTAVSLSLLRLTHGLPAEPGGVKVGRAQAAECVLRRATAEA